MTNHYNIFTKLYEDIDSYDNGTLTLASPKNEGLLRFSIEKSGGYIYSQKQTLNLIDLYYNSKFETGLYDSEGQRKTFLNKGKFRADVSAMQTDLDVANYSFIPDSSGDTWTTWLMARKFKVWARENYYGITMNELNVDYSRYGTCVNKSVGKKLVRVPLRTLICTQSAKSLKDAVDTSGSVMEVHYYSLDEMKSFPDWDTAGLDFEGKTTVYERYSKVPRAFLNEVNKKKVKESDWSEMVKTLSILVPNKEVKGHNEKEYKGTILFMEEVDEIPYEECHWEKQDGRWLGIGVIESLFENQIAANFNANLRRRSLLWASKKIFQSTDEAVKQNLVKEVRDGQILTIAPNGNITQIATESRNLAEFQADEQIWDKNGDQTAFTYEVATGEALPSGTPLGLGVLLTGATKKYYKLKQQNLGLFFERSFFTLLIPIFQKDTKNHMLTILGSEKGIENYKQAFIEIKTNENFIDQVMKGGTPQYEVIKNKVTEKTIKSPYFFTDVPSGFYKNAKYHMELNLTGEAHDVQADIQSYQFLYNALTAKQDPRADSVLEQLASLKGISLSALGGSNPQVAGQSAPQGTAVNQASSSAPSSDIPSGVSKEVKALVQ